MSFDAKADSDVTVISRSPHVQIGVGLGASAAARPLVEATGRPAKVDVNHLVIIGGHRTRVRHREERARRGLAKGPAVPLLPRGRDAFTRCFVSWYPKRGALVVASGTPAHVGRPGTAHRPHLRDRPVTKDDHAVSRHRGGR